MKGKLFALGLISIVLLPTIASAASIQTRINIINGSATVKQTINNQTLEIETNESANIQTNLTNSTLTYKINATGFGKLETNLTGDYRLTTIIDKKTESYSGFGVFSKVYNFLKAILSFGLVKW